MSNLLCLPTELLFHTMANLEPLDLIRLSQVCRRANEVASQRSVWETAFRSTCKSAQVFAPSYHPIEALDIGALKKGSLRPTVLAQTLTAWHGILPAAELVLENKDIFEPTTHPIGAQLVPGGRYVISAAERYISLWDLGATHPPSLPASPLSSVYPDSLPLRYWSISHPSSHLGIYLRFFALLWRKDQHAGSIIARKICVYEVGPLPSESNIRLLGELDVGFMVSRVIHDWILGDEVYLHVEKSILIWNFVTSELVSWDDIPERTHRSDSQLVKFGDKLALLVTRGVYTWDIPPLQPVEPHFVWESREHMNRPDTEVGPEPSYSQFRGDELPNDNLRSTPVRRSILCGPSKWYSGVNPTRPLIFIISELDGDDCIVNHLQVELRMEDGQPQATAISNFLPGDSPLSKASPARRHGHRTRHYSLSDDTTFSIIDSGTSRVQMVHSSRNVPGSDWEGGDCCTDHPATTLSGVDSLVCPVSARYVYVCDNMISHENYFRRIHVVSLLDL